MLPESGLFLSMALPPYQTVRSLWISRPTHSASSQLRQRSDQSKFATLQIDHYPQAHSSSLLDSSDEVRLLSSRSRPAELGGLNWGIIAETCVMTRRCTVSRGSAGSILADNFARLSWPNGATTCSCSIGLAPSPNEPLIPSRRARNLLTRSNIRSPPPTALWGRFRRSIFSSSSRPLGTDHLLPAVFRFGLPAASLIEASRLSRGSAAPGRLVGIWTGVPSGLSARPDIEEPGATSDTFA